MHNRLNSCKPRHITSGGFVAKLFMRGLKVAGAVAAIAMATAVPAQAAVYSAGTTVRPATAPPNTVTYTYGPFDSDLACDDDSAYYIGARGVYSVSDCWRTWQGYYFTVTYWDDLTTY